MISLMPSRLQELNEAIAGYQQTHVPLVAKGADGLQAAGIGNDLGPYYFAVKLADWFHLSAGTAITAFLVSCILVGLVAGLIGITLLWKKSRFYWWSVASLIVMSAIAYVVGDVYAAAAAIVIGTVPYLLLALRRAPVTPWQLVGFLALGLACGFANSVRSQSGTTVLLFAAIAMLIPSVLKRVDRVKLFAALLVGYFIVSAFFSFLVSKRDSYLRAHVPSYTQSIVAHTLWHSAYIGFGYLNNDLGLKYQDEVGIAKVASVDPGIAYLTPAYEAIIRTQTIDLIKANPLFAVMTIFSKLGVIFLLYLPFFANFGLWKAFVARRGGFGYLPFYVSLAFAALAGVLAIPELRYVTGFAALALLYGLTVLNDTARAK